MHNSLTWLLSSPSEPKGRESDAGFTPSPVDPHATYGRAFRSPHGPPSDTGSPQPSPTLSLTLAHQNKIRSMYASNSLASDTQAKRPGNVPTKQVLYDYYSIIGLPLRFFWHHVGSILFIQVLLANIIEFLIHPLECHWQPDSPTWSKYPPAF